jgi:DNA polymerase III subunit delta
MNFPSSLQSSPKPLYLLSSDEPLLVRDWLDEARKKLQQQGFEEIITHQVVAGFDWNAVLEDSQSLSLFSSLKCHIIRFGGSGPGQAGAKFIAQITEAPPEDVVFILVMGKLDRPAHNSAWFKKINQQGEVCELKPVYANELAPWIMQRAASKGIQLDRQAALYLADLTEGNLLASDQELEKLALTFGDGSQLDLEMIRESISRSARYNHFLLTDACLAGKTQRALKILQGLELEGVQPIQIQYALQGMLQTLMQLKLAQQLNQLNDNLWRTLNIWKSKQNLYSQALARYSYAQIERFIQSCATLDRINKGQEARYPQADWQAIRQLFSALLV